jgi:predicted nucleotide-binding protein
MKRLSNAELRTLYVLRASVQPISAAIGLRIKLALQYEPDLYDLVGRINTLRREVRDIVQDARFELQVPDAKEVKDGHQISTGLTAESVLTAATALRSYLDVLLELYLAPKVKDLEENPESSARVFIGHGRNGVVWPKVKTFVQDRCGLDPIVLELQPSTGLTVIEKLEKFGRIADYAVLVMTGDDRTEAGDVRTRQNIIQELGWFQGVLGRGHTAMLVQRGIEIPSNLGGIVYLDFPGDDVEMTFDKLRHELEATGLIETGKRHR